MIILLATSPCLANVMLFTGDTLNKISVLLLLVVCMAAICDTSACIVPSCFIRVYLCCPADYLFWLICCPHDVAAVLSCIRPYASNELLICVVADFLPVVGAW